MAKLLSVQKKAEGEGIGRVEAPRGECMHYVKMAGKEAPDSWKVKASSYSNLMSWIPMLQGSSWLISLSSSHPSIPVSPAPTG